MKCEEGDSNIGRDLVTKLSLGVTSLGPVSSEDFYTAHSLLVTIGRDELRPCRRDIHGKDIRNDMTPAMIKGKAKEKEEKIAAQDEIIFESGLPSKAKIIGK